MYIKDANNYDSCCLEWTKKDEETAINLHKLTVRCWWNLHRYSWKRTTCAGFFKNHKQPLCHMPNSDLVLGLARGFVQVLTLTDYALTRKFFLTLRLSTCLWTDFILSRPSITFSQGSCPQQLPQKTRSHPILLSYLGQENTTADCSSVCCIQ